MNMERYIEPEAEQPKEEKNNYKGIKQMAQTFGAVLTMVALNACRMVNAEINLKLMKH